MKFVRVDIVDFVDDHFPGFVGCHLVDAAGAVHRFVEKVPVVSAEALTRQSAYPLPGLVAVEVEAAWVDPGGRPLVRINTRPWGVETIDGVDIFVVEQSLVSEA